MPFDFRDANEKRGFSIINTDTGEHEFVENTVSPRFYILDEMPADGLLGERDFVRIKATDPKLAIEIAEAVQDGTAWVESATVEVESEPPRLEVHTKDTDEDLLARYVEHVTGEPNEALVQVGLEILKYAKR